MVFTDDEQKTTKSNKAPRNIKLGAFIVPIKSKKVNK